MHRLTQCFAITLLVGCPSTTTPAFDAGATADAVVRDAGPLTPERRTVCPSNADSWASLTAPPVSSGLDGSLSLATLTAAQVAQLCAARAALPTSRSAYCGALSDLARDSATCESDYTACLALPAPTTTCSTDQPLPSPSNPDCARATVADLERGWAGLQEGLAQYAGGHYCDRTATGSCTAFPADMPQGVRDALNCSFSTRLGPRTN